jgi:acyl carrier protein
MSISLDRSEVISELKYVLERATEGRIKSSSVGEDMDVIEELGVDSLAQLEIRFEIEQVWGLDVTDREVRKLRTVRQAADFIIDRAGGGVGVTDEGQNEHFRAVPR